MQHEDKRRTESCAERSCRPPSPRVSEPSWLHRAHLPGSHFCFPLFSLPLGCKLSFILPCIHSPDLLYMIKHSSPYNKLNLGTALPSAIGARGQRGGDQWMEWHLAYEKHLPTEVPAAFVLTAQRLSSRVTSTLPGQRICQWFQNITGRWLSITTNTTEGSHPLSLEVRSMPGVQDHSFHEERHGWKDGFLSC